jgi:O-antigen/teichoic acid export membrane protein
MSLAYTENTVPQGSSDNTRIIARNSLWYGLEIFFSLVVTFCTSVAVARVLGPTKLSHFQYMVWLTNITIAVGAFGLPITTRKYMAEYLNRDEAGVARSIYLATLKIQALIAAVILAVAILAVFWLEDPHRMVVSFLLVAAMTPRLIATIPSQANCAVEIMRRNTGPALAGGMVSTVLTLVSLVVGWDLVGVASAVVAGSVLECCLKLYSVERWLGGVARGPVAPELKKRMFSYSGQGMALMLLNVVVWDRSDMLILGAMNRDPNQITFFSLAFNVTERILMIPASFGGSLGMTMMAQLGRGQARLKEMMVDGARYAILLSLPLLVGLACISQPLVRIYGQQYGPMSTTLAIVALMAIPKVLVAAPTMLLLATERQKFLIAWGCVCGAIDIGLDILLTPRFGANGAAIANGTAQAAAALGTWIYIWKSDEVDVRLRDFGRIAAAGSIMGVGVLAFTRAVPGIAGTFLSIALGAALWMIALRVTGALKPGDVSRFLTLGRPLPSAWQPHWKRLISWLAPAGAEA